MLIDDMPEIPGLTSLGNVHPNDFDGSPLDLVFLPWAKMGTATFYLFVAYMAQLLFFMILGMGWSIGYTHLYNGAMTQWRYSPHLTLGSRVMHVHAGQKIYLHYTIESEKGCMNTYLAPAFGMPYHTPHSDGMLTGGTGDVVLVAPATAWVSLGVFSADGCNAAEVNDIRQNLGTYREAVKVGYRLSWHTDLARS